MKLKIWKAKNSKTLSLPFFTAAVQAGFPSPADDHIEDRLDLNELLIQNKTATFFVRVEGHSMKNAGITHGDILIVDRSITPSNHSVVIAVINGEFTVKKLHRTQEKIFLVPENEEYPLIEVTEEMDCILWGVVTFVIHPLKEALNS